MNLKVLTIIILYYSIITLIFFAPDSPIRDAGFTTNVDLNSTEITGSEQGNEGEVSETSALSTIKRFFKFTFFGVGLDDSTPKFAVFLIAIIQSLMTILTVGFIISSIWDG